ncbi:MAG: DUF1987 domain-containing protein [Flavobacteriales bacterium]|nr:DUF1987 domain-containing protein [Flavobacteriales bacterium]
MNKFFVVEGRNTPKINFDPGTGVFEISGKSYPENAERFFRGPLLWLRKYGSEEETREIQLVLKFEFISSASVICVLQLLKEMDNMRAKGFSFAVQWYVQEDDEDIKITGEDLESLSGELVFEYITE